MSFVPGGSQLLLKLLSTCTWVSNDTGSSSVIFWRYNRSKIVLLSRIVSYLVLSQSHNVVKTTDEDFFVYFKEPLF